MIFSLIIILLIGVVAYFHYLQGLFSATLSTIFVVIAAAVAVGWHETLVEMLLAGRYSDQAGAMVLCATFAAVYIVLRIIADKFIPGAVLVPVAADKIGAGVMGVISGLIAGGLVAFAAQMLPYGPSIAGYSRLPLGGERYAVIPPAPGRMQSRDAAVYGELTAETLDAPQQGMFVPADDFVIGMVSMMSNGSLSTGQPLSELHPDWLLELFGQRLGVEPGTKHTAVNKASAKNVTVEKELVVLPGVGQRDGEIKDLRVMKFERVLRPGAGRALIVVPTTWDKDAADSDFLARVSTAGVRLVANGKNYFPLGTIDAAGILVVNRPDDYLFADTKTRDAKVAFLFDVEASDVLAGATGAAVRNGVFFEAKRLAREDIGGRPVTPKASYTGGDDILRKASAAGATPAATPATPEAAPAAPAAPAPAPVTPAAPPEQPQGRDVMPVP